MLIEDKKTVNIGKNLETDRDINLKYENEGITAYQTLKTATRGGAEVLGRYDTGLLEAGKAADIVLINLNDVAFAGCHDPVVGIVSCGNSSIVDTTIVNGKMVVRKGQIITKDEGITRINAHRIAKEMVAKERRV